MLGEGLAMYQTAREQLLAQITAALAADSRIAAAWLGGSLGAGNADALSDLDVWVVVEDEHCQDVYAECPKFVERVGSAVLHLTAPQNAPVGGAYRLVLYAGQMGALHVDWYWQPRSTTTVPPSVRLLFDRVGLPDQAISARSEEVTSAHIAHKMAFFWAMLAIVPKKIARDDGWTAVAMLRMVAMTLEETKALLGLRPLPTYKDQPAWAVPADTQSQFAMVHALIAAMESLAPTLHDHGVAIPAGAIESVKRLVALIAEGR